MISIREYLIEKHDGSPVKGKPAEITMPCPVCGKAENHFQFNIVKMKGNCFKCSYSVLSAESLFAELEQVSVEVARDLIFYSDLQKTAAEKAVDALHGRNVIHVEDDSASVHVNHDLPFDFIPIAGDKLIQMPAEFKKRGYALQTIKKLGIGFCREGDYAARLIFPITCNDKKSFYARKLISWMEPKYKNPPGALHSQILYNYNNIPEDVDHLFVCEGCTDVVRLTDYGFFAVACSGKKISKIQIDLITDKKPKEVVSVFDGEAFKQNMRAFEKLGYRLNTSYMTLPRKGGDTGEYYDPDNAPRPVFEEAFKKRVTVSKIKNTLNLLGGEYGTQKCR